MTDTATAVAAASPARTRIGYVMSRFPKLSETFVLNEILAVEALGADVELYPLLRERPRDTHPETDRLVGRARYQPFLSLPILRANIHFLRQQPRAYLRLWREVLRGTWRSTNFLVGAIGIFPKSVRFAWEMQRRGVTHVHAHFATHPALAALIVHRLTGIPFSFTAHGSDLHVDRTMLAAKLAAAAFAVTVSDYNRDVMVAECGAGTRDRIHVIHCGVDADAFAPTARTSGAGPLRIVCVASLEEVKGHRFLIEACRLLRARGVDFRCELVGGGPLRRSIARQIAHAGLADCVIMRGPLPRPAIARLLAGADVAALASHPTRSGKREGIPVALMEAMAAGLPVVATRISGIPELVTDGVTGLLVPSGDPIALAGALHELGRDPQLRTELGRNARARVIADFSLHASAAALLDLIAPTSRSAVAPAALRTFEGRVTC